MKLSNAAILAASATAASLVLAPSATTAFDFEAMLPQLRGVSPSTQGAPGARAGFSRFFDKGAFEQSFPGHHALYSYNGLVAAARAFPAFANSGDETKDKLELAAFLAQASHESDRFTAPEEHNSQNYPESQYCEPRPAAPCAPGKRYHGRGALQLSWNYNYDAAGKALKRDLLKEPELVGKDPELAWQTALWYWTTPQREGKIIHSIITGPDGFAQSTNIINGALECGPQAKPEAKASEQQRIANFQKLTTLLKVQPLGKVSCNA